MTMIDETKFRKRRGENDWDRLARMLALRREHKRDARVYMIDRAIAELRAKLEREQW